MPSAGVIIFAQMPNDMARPGNGSEESLDCTKTGYGVIPRRGDPTIRATET